MPPDGTFLTSRSISSEVSVAARFAAPIDTPKFFCDHSFECTRWYFFAR